MGRSPCGERGLKFGVRMSEHIRLNLSLPVRGAWIEMAVIRLAVSQWLASLPVRGAWIEILGCGLCPCPGKSLPVRGAWIEIPPIAL